MINSIETGNRYKLVLDQSNWPGISFSVVISGITNKEAMGNITDYNLKEELFMNYEIGLNTYLNMTNCNLYIVQEITDFTTGEFSDDIILIPELMIDYKLSEKLIEVYDIKYQIDGVKRRFTRSKDLNDFITSSKIKLVKQLNFLDEFTGLNLSVTPDYSSYYTDESSIKKEEKIRSERITSYNNQKLLTKSANEAIINKAAYNIKVYTDKLLALNKETENLNKEKERVQQFYNDTIDIFVANDEYTKVLKETYSLMKEKADELGVEIKSYEDYFNQAKENVKNDVTEPEPEPPDSETDDSAGEGDITGEDTNDIK